MKTTPYFNLPLYEAGDKPNLADGYNEAMQQIDRILQSQKNEIADLKNQIVILKGASNG